MYRLKPDDPAGWTEPRDYDVAFRFGADRVRERIGFREIRADGEHLLLNGQKIYLRGVCVHEDDVAVGKCTDEADLQRRFAHAREPGANFLRLAHYPHHERVAEIADTDARYRFMAGHRGGLAELFTEDCQSPSGIKLRPDIVF